MYERANAIAWARKPVPRQQLYFITVMCVMAATGMVATHYYPDLRSTQGAYEPPLALSVTAVAGMLAFFWVVLLLPPRRRYRELRAFAEGLYVVGYLGRRRLIPWHDVTAMESILPRRAVWRVQTRRGPITIEYADDHTLALVDEISRRIPQTEQHALRRRQPPPWEALPPRTYRRRAHIGWFVTAFFSVLGAGVLYAAGHELFVRRWGALPLALGALGFCALLFPGATLAWREWRRFRGFQMRTTEAGIEVTDASGRHDFCAWEDVLGMHEPSDGGSPIDEHQVLIARTRGLLICKPLVVGWRDLGGLIYDAAAYNLETSAGRDSGAARAPAPPPPISRRRGPI